MERLFLEEVYTFIGNRMVTIRILKEHAGSVNLTDREKQHLLLSGVNAKGQVRRACPFLFYQCLTFFVIMDYNVFDKIPKGLSGKIDHYTFLQTALIEC
jgi:hypothetical protein